MRYLVSDLHLGHEDVFEYTDRPFGSVAEMNRRLLSGWNDAVGDGDEVVFLGDFAVPSEPTTIRRWLGQLAGDIVFVAGDHDDGVGRTRAVSARDAFEFAAGGYRFHCVHDPADAPPGWDGWVVHGHHHDRRLREFPFLDPNARRINVSVELLGYEPIPVAELLEYVDRRRRFRRRPDSIRRSNRA